MQAWLSGALVMGLVGLATGCASDALTNGEVIHFRVDPSDHYKLRGPWFDAGNSDRAIHAGDGTGSNPDEVFQLVFNTAFMKYLPDIAGVNEVMVVFTFEDGPVAKDEDRIVKILGPMRRQPDGTLLPDVSRITFGPTALQGKYLSVDVQVVEFDREEANNTSAFIDFIGNSAESLSLADPVTSSEIKVAKEIGKALVQTNQNDIVLQAHFDLIPFDSDVWEDGAKSFSTALPLRTGIFGVIKTEVPFQLYTFFPFTSKLEYHASGHWTGGAALWGDWVSTPFTLLGDVVMLPFTAVVRSISDLPDRASMQPLARRQSYFQDAEDGTFKDLVLNADERTLSFEGDPTTLYRNKSWLVFSVSRGHEAIPVEARKWLTESDQVIQGMLKQRALGEVLNESGLQAAIDSLVKARQAAEATRAVNGFKLVSPAGGYFDDTDDDGTALETITLDISRPDGQDFSARLLSRALEGGAAPVELDQVQDRLTTVTHGARLVFTNTAPFASGSYVLALTFRRNDGTLEIANLPVTIVQRPTARLSLASATNWPQGTTLSVVEAESGDFAQVQEVTVTYELDGSRQSMTCRRTDYGCEFGAREITLRNKAGRDIPQVQQVVLTRSYALDPLVIAPAAEPPTAALDPPALR